MKRKLLSIVLALCLTLTLTLLPTMSVAAGSYADTNGHWAESSIERWSAYGIIQGSNGQFDPNGQLTCAQLATILAKLLKLPAAKDAGFSDNKADAWYYDAINRCAAAGILNGNGDGTVTPEALISRERTMVMLGRALGIEPIREPDLTKYTDAAKVAPYAQGMVAAMIEAGIVGGVTADELAPQDNINRASTVTILDRAISTYADEAGATVKADGKGIVLVVAKNVKVENAPEGTKIIAGKDATGLTVNSKSVSDDQTYIVPKTEPAKPSNSSSGGHSHSHSYDAITHKCSCGEFDPAVVATIGNTNGYLTLKEAVAAASNGATITLVGNITTNEGIRVAKKITLDMAGRTITSSVNQVFTVTGSGDLTITGNGTIAAPSGEAAKKLDSKAVLVVSGESAKLTVLNGTITAGGVGDCGMYGIYVAGGGNVILGDADTKTGPTITAWFAAVGENNTTSPANITIYGGEYTAQAAPADSNWWAYFCAPVYASASGDINISGGTFNGYYGISSRYVNVGQKLNISGGTFNGSKSALFADTQTGTACDKTRTIAITGGTFSSDPSEYVAAGYAAKKLEDDKYQVVALFYGGSGTEEDPFLIATSEQFKAIDYLNGASYCFKQTADIAVAAGDEVTKFAGVYDGGNQELSSARTSGKFAALFNVAGLSGHATFKNINVTMGELATSLLSCVDWGTSYGADFENLTFTSTSELTKANSNNFGFVVINAIYTDKGDAAAYNFKDITVNVNLQNAGTCTGVLIGSGPCLNISTTMNFINCTNNGTITGTSSVGFLYGNSAYIESLDESGMIKVTNCTTNAVIKSTKDSADVAFAPGASKSTKADALNASYQQADKYIVGNCLNGKTISVTQNAGADKFSIAIDDASGYTYKLVLNVAATYRTLDGEAWNDADVAKIPSKWDEAWNVSNGLKYLIALSKDTNITGTLNSFHAYDKRTAANKGIETNTLTYNEDGYAIVVKNGTNCVVFNTTEDTYIDSSVSILVYAYSGNTLVGTRGI